MDELVKAVIRRALASPEGFLKLYRLYIIGEFESTRQFIDNMRFFADNLLKYLTRGEEE